MKLRLFSFVCILAVVSLALRAKPLSLDGAWGFALDPQRRGEALGWPALKKAEGATPWTGWDTVTVPHSWSGDPRYEHTGAAWYVRSFEVPAEWTDSHLRLRFSSVGDRCRVWLNGKLLASHDGVNLPFSIDVTPHVQRPGANILVLEVDNSFNDQTIPGSRPGNTPNSQLYPWWNYGGILGPVTLESEPAARIASLQTHYEFRGDGSVAVTFRTHVENRAGAAASLHLGARITPPVSGAVPLESRKSVNLGAGQTQEVSIVLTVPAGQVRRWDLDRPVLYPAEVTLGSAAGATHTVRRRLGLREIAVRDAQLLLNGEPVRVAGANRARGHRVWAGLEPKAMAEQDMTLLKNAHLEFSRFQHYPISEPLLDWADEHGMLIIAEPGNWQFAPEQLGSPALQKLWRQQMGEMIENARDRPSVIAWSVGNEYNSWSPEGVAWTRDMAAWVRSLDPSRPVTFASLAREMRPSELPKEQRSFQHVDFICINYYGGPNGVAGLDRVHALWPDKPIMISEFGLRADQVASESVRIEHFRGTLAEVRKRPYICGLSYWTFNDYLSRYPGTTPDGYRAWGIVTGDRTPRELYAAIRDALSPVAVTLKTDPARPGSAQVVVTAGSSFPSRVLRGYTLRVFPPGGGAPETVMLPDLAPAATWERAFNPWLPGTRVEILRPNGTCVSELGL